MGAELASETDTEVVAHLVTQEMSKGHSPADAVAAALPRLRGAFALAFLFKGEENLLIGARKGSPLAIGYGEGEMFLGSDAIALAPFTDAISYLEDGDSALLTRNRVEIRDAKGSKAERTVMRTSASTFLIDKGNYQHFMAKEIHEQPEVVGHTIAQYLDMAGERVSCPRLTSGTSGGSRSGGRIPKIRPVQPRISGLVGASTCCRGGWIKDTGVLSPIAL
jgi:glutamine---fructose-6-phosphate transaminase (isomerizing)